MKLNEEEIHIWSGGLSITSDREAELKALLNADEVKRAERFLFPIHRTRFIAARSMLRIILSKYVNCPPINIVFGYTEFNKPYLVAPSDTDIQFNLSHSEDMAVYALTQRNKIGVDIEKVQINYNHDVAVRFFSPHEIEQIERLDDTEKCVAFYRIWSKKEALIKAVGMGLGIPLSSFSVSVQDKSERISLEKDTWSLLPLLVQADFQAAVATNQTVKKVSYWQVTEQMQVVKKSSF